jgi:hypothetical protein
MDLAYGKDVLETLHLIQSRTGLRSWDMTLKIFLAIKAFKLHLSKRVDSILNQNTINTIYSI